MLIVIPESLALGASLRDVSRAGSRLRRGKLSSPAGDQPASVPLPSSCARRLDSALPVACVPGSPAFSIAVLERVDVHGLLHHELLQGRIFSFQFLQPRQSPAPSPPP